MDLTKVPILKQDKDILVTIPKSYYEKTSIIDLPPFKVHLIINQNYNQDYILDLESQGYMILQDSISLEPVKYPFQIKISEKIDLESETIGNFIANFQNTLDIIGVLWENIVLEIPISFTTCELQEEIHDNWKIIGPGKENPIDPRLVPLMEIIDKEKE